MPICETKHKPTSVKNYSKSIKLLSHHAENTKMPCWYYDKNDLRDTPSVHDGITYETERRYRKEGARFIMSCGTQMGLGHNTMATGVVYFHRFYMFHSFKSFPRYVTACCCLLLAGKVEETPKKCRDIIRTARGLLSDNYFYSFGADPKEEVMTLERILLQTIKFDLQVEHPYTFLLKYAKCIKGDQQKLQKMVQMAWNFVNDSLSTTVCLQWEPEIIAVALIHLASKLSKFTVVDWIGRQSNHTRWWDMFVSDVTMEILEDICHQVLDLYQTNQKEPGDSQSPPQKPPSRADSPPTTGPQKSVNANNNTGSPSNKTKSAANVVAPHVPPITSNASGSTGMEINNIQAIKSLANPTPAVPMSLDMPSTVSSALNNAYNMYATAPPHVNTHHIHSLYGNPGIPPGGAVPPAVNANIPQPPLPAAMGGPSYGASSVVSANAWTAPPPPAAPGYYHPPPYGRQQRY